MGDGHKKKKVTYIHTHTRTCSFIYIDKNTALSPTLSIGSLYKSVVIKRWVVKQFDSILSLCSPFRPLSHNSLKLPDRTAEEILRKQMFPEEVGRTGYLMPIAFLLRVESSQMGLPTES